MSTVKALADAEAARAEAENPDAPPAGPTPEEDEEGHEDETAGKPEQPGEPEQPGAEAQLKAITSELRRHERAWAKLVGVEPDALNVCPTCEGVGFTETAQPLMKDSTYTERCDECNGYGEVLSGSVVERTRVVKCLACGGMGYKRTDMATPAPENGTASVTVAAAGAEDPDVARLREQGYTVFKAPPVSVGT